MKYNKYKPNTHQIENRKQ